MRKHKFVHSPQRGGGPTLNFKICLIAAFDENYGIANLRSDSIKELNTKYIYIEHRINFII